MTSYSKLHGVAAADEKVARIPPQFSSERLSPFRRQAEVLSPMLKGTNFDKWLSLPATFLRRPFESGSL
jgi:hypothetical protein